MYIFNDRLVIQDFVISIEQEFKVHIDNISSCKDLEKVAAILLNKTCMYVLLTT